MSIPGAHESRRVFPTGWCHRGITWLLCLGFVTGTNSFAADSETPPPDKSAFTLFHPTPDDLMRELNTDRPDKTESPYTVDAGHYQIESDFFTSTYDHETAGGADVRASAWSFATLNLKAGLCNHADLQLILNPYNTLRTTDHRAGTVRQQGGFGDALVRLKINFWGDDGGSTAGGILPFVKIPSSQDNLGNHAVEGGLILPLAVSLPLGWDLGLMAEFDFNQDSAGAGYHPEFVNSITFDHSLIGKLDGYAEFFSVVSTETGAAWIGTVDFGLLYGITKNIQIDGGINIGITKSAEDWNPFLGISIRF